MTNNLYLKHHYKSNNYYHMESMCRCYSTDIHYYYMRRYMFNIMCGNIYLIPLYNT